MRELDAPATHPAKTRGWQPRPLPICEVDAPARRVLFFKRIGCPLLLLALAIPLLAQEPGGRRSIVSTGSLFGDPPALGDFDGDGHLDLAESLGFGIAIYLNDGFGRFEESSLIDLIETTPRLITVRFVVPGDLDGDGNTDLVGADSRLTVFLRGLGDGTFEPPRLLEPADRSACVESLIVDHFDEDEWVDVAVVCCSTIHVLPGGPRFPERRLALPAPEGCPDFLAAGDLDGDSIPDLISWGGSRTPPSIRRGLGGGAFAEDVAATSRPGVLDRGSTRSAWQIADFDRDGREEVAILRRLDGASLGTTEVLLLRDAGVGTFEVSVSSSIEKAPVASGNSGLPLVSADLDGDSWADLVTLGDTRGELLVLRNQARGAAEFEVECTLPLLGLANSFTSGDMDRDGDLDLLVNAGRIDGRLEILFSPLGLCGSEECELESIANAESSPANALIANDFTGDSIDELLAVRNGEARLLSWRGGEMTTLSRIPIPPQTIDLEVFDLDGDGRLDLATLSPSQDVVLLHLLGENQILDAVLEIELPDAACAVETVDVNQDDRTDILVCLTRSQQIITFLGEGRGRFAEGRISEIGARPDDFAVGDFDGDGSQDVAVLVRRTRSVRFIPGTDDGFFGLFLPAEDVPLPARTVPGPRIHAADLGGDGITDVVTLALWPTGHAVTAIHGSDNGRFEPLTVSFSNIPNPALGLADVLPGRGVELLIANSTSRSLEIGFPARSYPLSRPVEPGEPLVVAGGDLDGDGQRDVAVARALHGDVEVLTVARCARHRDAAEFRRGDVNQDGAVQLADAVAALQHLFAAGGDLSCEDAADADDDGALNLADPVRILAFLFSSGVAPAPPGPLECGRDPSADELRDCEGGCQA